MNQTAANDKNADAMMEIDENKFKEKNIEGEEMEWTEYSPKWYRKNDRWLYKKFFKRTQIVKYNRKKS